MAMEIERKFLVADPQAVLRAEIGRHHIMQGYLSREPDRTVRVRLLDDRGFLTVKGLTRRGIERREWEFEIPAEDARQMLELCQGLINKVRHLVEFGGHTWEVDEFLEPHEGLWLAEVELKSPDEAVELPSWIGEEVTGNPQYYNSNLGKSAENA